MEYNADLTKFYTDWRAERPTVGMWSQDWTIPEPTQDEYNAAGMYENALAYSDTAIFLVARSGGEGADLPTSYYGEYSSEGSSGNAGISEYPDDIDPEKHYLELSNRERATLEALNEKFENIIVVVNCAAAMEMGFIEEYDSIKAAVYVPGGPGQNGFNALGSILVGDVNPFGKTVDTVISSIGKTQQIDCDGPASINNNFTGKGSIGFTSAVMIASTWNEDIAERFGESIGQMADEMNVSGWYAPAMNTHRSAFAGRNFEYYSEDGFIAGKMAANAVAGAETHGVYSFIKHFALNDQETNRSDGLCTWSNEQAIREIYLKPFELAVKEGGADAAMSAFNHIGNEYAGACNELLINVLRGEWGFKGMVLTDYFMGGLYQDADIQIRNGNDFCLSPMGGGTDVLDDQSSATSILAARQACKNILYVTANSRAYSSEVLNPGMPTWQLLTYGISLALAALLVLVELKKYKKFKASKAEAK